MIKQSFKDLVLTNFPKLTVKRCYETPNLFGVFNQHNQQFNEKTRARSARKSWEIAYRLILRDELRPDWKEESEESITETHALLEEAKLAPNWRPMSHEDVDKMISEVLRSNTIT